MTTTMIIKVCGMREPENIRAIEQAGADWMGFIFFPQSARYVITSSGIPAGTMPPDRSLRQRKQRKHPAESTGIRSAPYPVAWQGNTGTMPQIKSRRIRNH